MTRFAVLLLLVCGCVAQPKAPPVPMRARRREVL
jgi:hypothetical protein